MSPSKLLAVLLALIFSSTAFAAGGPKVSLLLGDMATRQAIDMVRSVTADHPELAGADIRVYSSTRVREQDLDHLAASDIVVIQTIGRVLINSIRDELAQAIARGATVYAYGRSVNEDDEAAGIVADPEIQRYFDTGGTENIRNGLLYALSRKGLDLPFAPPHDIPDVGLYEASTKSWFTGFDAFLDSYRNHHPGKPWVGFVVYQSNVVAGTTRHIDAVIDALERRGFNVLTVFGYPPEEPIGRFFFDDSGRSRVEAVIAAAIKIGVNPETLVPLLQRLDVPVINAISLYSLSRSEWESSGIGMDVMERSWQLAMPEMAGMTQPTVFAAKERVVDPETGTEYVEEQAIPERVEMLARRIARWVELRRKPNSEKRVLLHYFNFPPGREGIGASYLNVVPESLWSVLKRMEQEGYDVSGMPADPETLRDEVIRYGANLPNWEHDEIEALARSGEPVLLPVETYKEWFAELPQKAQDEVIASWGRPEVNTIMAHIDDEGKRYFIFPVRRYGNVLLAPQPSRGKTESPDKLYHDVSFPPSHQYVAFYLWLHKEFGADVMFQFGSHGTHEWLPGKEAGLGADDSPDYLVQDMPNLYNFIMDNTGEGTIAMRRGMATMITHLTPPFDRASLNPELRELEARIQDFSRAVRQSPELARVQLEGIREMAAGMGLLTDLGFDRAGRKPVLRDDDDYEDDEEAEDALDSADQEGHQHFSSDVDPDGLADALFHYLEEMSDRITPFGMHTFGVAPRDERVRSTAEAIASIDSSLSDEQRAARVAELEALIRLSAQRELDAAMAGMSGRYIAAGIGGDPLRTPAALPTGRNFYSFDPRKIPGDASYRLGRRLATELVDDYRYRHGEYPEKLTFTLWGVETMRHEGVQEAQIMYLMGIRPVYDGLGVVRGVEAIPREELGRPRIDVTVIPSGLYRDLFSNVVALLDQAVTLAQAQDEPDNFVRNNTLRTQAMLEERGVESELAARMAAVRMFSVPPGAYGTNIENVVSRSDTWEDDGKVADVYFMRMSHMYGQGFWGDTGEASGVAGVGRDLLKNALSGTRMTVHARSSHVYQVLDGDDPFASFGGVSLAVRAVDGTTPEVMISNIADPARAGQETLERFMGREMRSRYLNPEWIKAMQEEGYAGAKMINQVVGNMWGWQVTVPEAIDGAKWNEMYETYVNDRYDLDMEQFFREAGNLWALQSLMTRMLEAVRKGYWQADQAVIDDLGQKVSELIQELQIQCSAEDCHDPILTKLVQANLVPAPMVPMVQAAVAAAPAPDSPAAADGAPGEPGQLEHVQGYAMEEVTYNPAAEFEQSTRWMQVAGFLLLCLALGWGFRRAHPGRRLDRT